MSTAVALLQQKRLVRARAQLDAQRVADALLKAQGADGKKGDKGDTGPMPGHEWQGTKLRFEKPDGGWGELVELRGPKGARGDRGPGGQGSGGAAPVAPPVGVATVLATHRFVITQEQSDFVLPGIPINGICLLSLNGILQHDYACLGNTVSINPPAEAGDDIIITWWQYA